MAGTYHHDVCCTSSSALDV